MRAGATVTREAVTREVTVAPRAFHRRACKIAGVEPVFKESDGALDEDQIKSLVLSLNNNRRHLTSGQKAMAVAIAYPVAEHGGDRKSSTNLVLDKDVNKNRLSQARKILRFTPSQVPSVMSGSLPFSIAGTCRECSGLGEVSGSRGK